MTKTFQSKPDREPLQLPFRDYPLSGEYLVTICTQDGAEHFGTVEGGKMQLSPAGIIAKEEWRKIAAALPKVRLDTFIVMPGHLHGILMIVGHDTVESLGSIIGRFKSACAKRIRDAGFRNFRWQAGYFQYAIRDKTDLDRVRNYVVTNPLHWKSGKVFSEDIQMDSLHAKA